MKLMMLLLCILFVGASVFAQGTVTVTGTDLSPTFSPGTSTPILRLSFTIVGTPMINYIRVNRTGTATNTDVPTAKLWRDLNKDDVVNGSDVQLDQTRYFQGSGTQNAYFQSLNYYPSTSENLLITYDVAAEANTSNTAGADMPAGYITGGNLTTVIFAGITTGNQPLPVELTSFTALVQNKSVSIKWQTATEVNNYGFEIQRQNTEIRSQKSEWETLGFVQGHGNSNSPKEYSFTDNLAFARDLTLTRIQYRLKQIDFDGAYEYSNIVEVNFDAPVNFVLNQNYPNPFNPSTTINFSLPKDGVISLEIFNLLGEKVATLLNGYKPAGNHSVNFDASNLASGVYLYRISSAEYAKTLKMNFIK